jgi:hypothetical protein
MIATSPFSFISYAKLPLDLQIFNFHGFQEVMYRVNQEVTACLKPSFVYILLHVRICFLK